MPLRSVGWKTLPCVPMILLGVVSCASDDDAIASCYSDETVQANARLRFDERMYEYWVDEIADSKSGEDPITWSYLVYDEYDGGNPFATEPRIYRDGNTLVIDGAYRESAKDYGALVTAAARCVLEAIEVPPAVDKAIEQTSAIKGLQSAEFDGREIQWSYHPDDGLFLTVTPG